MEQVPVLGIDAGSIAVSVALVSPDGAILERGYDLHHGDIRGTIMRLLSDMDPPSPMSIAKTSSTSIEIEGAGVVDNRVAFITAARRLFPRVGSILIVGGEKFGLATFSADGEYLNYRGNTSCAAGTGSFLDQQAVRLNIGSMAEFSRLAYENTGEVPKIASRCSVFAKTDLIHAQQEGYRISEICDGLCYGLAKNISDTLFNTGEELREPVIFIGGVSRNRAVVKHLSALSGKSLTVHPDSPLFGATGAAFRVMEEGAPEPVSVRFDTLFREIRHEKRYHHPPLRLAISQYPDFPSLERFEYVSPRFTGIPAVETDIYEDLRSRAERSDRGTAQEAAGADPRSRRADCEPPEGEPGTLPVYLGIDIGSTSTKGVLVDHEKTVLAGFYTRTAGKPVEAVQAVFECIDHVSRRKGVRFLVRGFGTTGSGRSFIGSIFGADSILDEISAHARAAYELDPDVDTIIEIGGQDSKFTTMKNGMVTMAVMNTVCAAGTGSFVEEQAKRLSCPLSDYAERVEGIPAPLSSDRCTVFMERDINNSLRDGYSVDETLASVLHSICANYLCKVAVEHAIGDRIFFQGATAKNRALVAAFEQRLGKPIMVSRFCHLTGAIGVALQLADERAGGRTAVSLPVGNGAESPVEPPSKFAGLHVHESDIPVRQEICDLCANHCKLKVAVVDGHETAFGFLCGRDYETKKRVPVGSSRFDPAAAWSRLFPADSPGSEHGQEETADTGHLGPSAPAKSGGAPIIGIPAALHLFEETGLWRRFFGNLGIRVMDSSGFRNGVKKGKGLTGSEFCAPITALHGHVAHLLESGADWIFLPIYLENPGADGTGLRNYCYYTQFAPSVISLMRKTAPAGSTMVTAGEDPQEGPGEGNRLLMPLLKSVRGSFHMKMELYQTLKRIPGFQASILQVFSALEEATRYHEERRDAYARIYLDEEEPGEDIGVVLLGRPYTVLDPGMNSGIPGIFSRLGIRTFSGEMIAVNPGARERIAPLLSAMNWEFASRILETAQTVAETPGLYPVFITSFKCSPDSFAVEYFKKIMESRGKPYLILQLDEHDSSLGYQTRIEAGIRSFRNHFRTAPGVQREAAARGTAPGVGREAAARGTAPGVQREAAARGTAPGVGREAAARGTAPVLPPSKANPDITSDIESIRGKTLLMPSWDPFIGKLLEAVLRSEGVDARLMPESEQTIREGLSHNTGQCIPLNAVTQDCIAYIEREGLDPEKTALWMAESTLSCNIRMFPCYIKALLERHGKGLERTAVYLGDILFLDFSPRMGVTAYFAYMFGGYLRKLACKVRPYEKTRGMTDRVVAESLDILYRLFLEKRFRKEGEETVEKIVSKFLAVPTIPGRRPLVAIFGDLYVRDNDVMNQDLIRTIEEAGGEAIVTPYSEFIKAVSGPYFHRWFTEGKYVDVATTKVLMKLAVFLERKYRRLFNQVLREPDEFPELDPKTILEYYHVRLDHTGESMENLMKTYYLKLLHPDISLFIQASPAFCCASLVTKAMDERIEEVTGIPVLSIEYDGTGAFKNEDVIPYLKFPRKDRADRAGRTVMSGGKETAVGGNPQQDSPFQT